MSNERDILKSLLLKEELELLDTIKQKLLSEEQFTKEVSNVLAAALKRAQHKDKNIERALAWPIKEGVKRAFVDSKQSIIDSLLPIMGQLIRKTVTNSIKQFVSDINRILEQRFSVKYIKWRWQAFRTGSSLAQIVFQNTVHYQVSEIFLINRENGLLIQHVGADDMLKDNNAISGMLTAIQDFVGDSLKESDSQLESIEIKGKQFLFSFGPKAYLAAIVLGSPTERIKEKLQQLIENAHGEFSEDLLDENNYDKLPDLNGFLRSNLVTKSLTPETKKINWLPWAIIILILSIFFIYSAHKKSLAYDKIVSSAESIDGFILQDVNDIDSGYEITGLLDPMADISALHQDNISLVSRAFISIDPSIIEKRINKAKIQYPNVTATLVNNTLYLKGSIAEEGHTKLIKSLEKIIGVDEIDNQLTINRDEEIEEFINKYPMFSQQSIFEPQKQALLLKGETTQMELDGFKNSFKKFFPTVVIDDSYVSIQETTENLIQTINNTHINLADIETKNIEDEGLNRIVNSLHLILNREVKIQLKIIGESDCYGSNSNQYSLLRAQAVRNVIRKKNINENILLPTIIPCTVYNSNTDATLLNVSFRIKEVR